MSVMYKNGSIWENLMLEAYPVGAIYISSDSTSPASLFGGTWSPLSESRYLRLAGEWSVGGSNTITIDNLPPHVHELDGWNFAPFGGGSDGQFLLKTGNDPATTTRSTGSGTDFYPAYRNCYAWYRTA